MDLISCIKIKISMMHFSYFINVFFNIFYKCIYYENIKIYILSQFKIILILKLKYFFYIIIEWSLKLTLIILDIFNYFKF